MAYWKRFPTLGLGPSAHSFFPPRRIANICTVSGYVEAVEKGRLPVEYSEELSAESAGNEIIFLGMRTSAGVDERDFEAVTGSAFQSPGRSAVLKSLMQGGFILYRPPRWLPTARGMCVADEIARRLV
jgi:oxygen-independent coproporphyrinogen-3 oxidase